jgi:hypothetical protein
VDTLMILLRRPAWPILLWAGLAAALVAAFVQVDGRPGLRARIRAVLLGLASAPLYGLIFEAVGRADLPLGACLGLAHGVLAFALRRRDRTKRVRFLPVVAAWILFGAVLAWLYPAVRA